MIKNSKQESLVHSLYDLICKKGEPGLTQEVVKRTLLSIMKFEIEADGENNKFKDYNECYMQKMTSMGKLHNKKNQSLLGADKEIMKEICNACGDKPTLNNLLTIMKQIQHGKTSQEIIKEISSTSKSLSKSKTKLDHK